MIVSYLPDPERHPLWEGIKGLLERAGDSPVENELVWIAYDGPILFGAGTTLLYDDGEAEIRLCGGFRHREWVNQALEIVELWARNCGAVKLTMRGRKGWGRYMRPFGWVALGVDDGKHTFEKVLTDGQ